MTALIRDPDPSYQIPLPAGKVEARLHALIRRDLSFKGRSTGYASHNTHAFAAKFPPQLPRMFIDELTQPGELIIDPMAGSGTTLVEAMFASRRGLGVDLDPLAVKISKAKTTKYDLASLEVTAEKIVDHARLISATLPDHRFGPWFRELTPKTAQFLEYWFLPDTANQLWSLIQGIRKLCLDSQRNFFEVIFSSLIITKSGGVTLARDLAHSRPHKVADKSIRNAIDLFRDNAKKAILSASAIQDTSGSALAIQADSRCLPIQSSSVDLIVTSPPYANAIDYMRAHKFSLIWLGHDIESLSAHRRRYIGAELGDQDGFDVNSKTAINILREIKERDRPRAAIIAKYFRDMQVSIGEMYRVLKVGRAAVIVIGCSTVRGLTIPTPFVLAEIAERAGFKVVGIAERQIDRDKRLMPISIESSKFGIEARIHREHVIALVKQ